MADEKPRVLAVGASMRSTRRFSEKVLQIADDATSIEDLLSRLEEVPKKEFSNTDAQAAMVLYQAKQGGAEIDWIDLRNLFPRGSSVVTDHDITSMGLDSDALKIDTTKIDRKQLQYLQDGVDKADGVVATTPVYFGDRSSILHTFVKLCYVEGKMLNSRGFGIASAGAKRNGGQETTNTYAMYEALSMDAIVHGNGTKTSQYGGTAHAGDRKAILEDKFGIETTIGTGRRAAQIAGILKRGFDTPEQELAPYVDLKILVTMDTPDKKVESKIMSMYEKMLSLSGIPQSKLEIINLVDYKIQRCLACADCPFPPMVENGSRRGTDYACIIDPKDDSDGMEEVRERLKGADAILIAGANVNYPGLIDSYQQFTERTRFMRRGNFELMNVPTAPLVVKDVFESYERLWGTKVMTSYVRHNTTILSPVRMLEIAGFDFEDVVDQLGNNPIAGKIRGDYIRPEHQLENFLSMARIVNAGRAASGPVEVGYIAGGSGGYRDGTSLDQTTAIRQ